MTVYSKNFSCNSFKPVVLQVIDVKRVRCSLADDGCYCLSITFSDGSHSIVGFLTKNLEGFVQSGRLRKTSVLVLTRFFFSSLLSRKVLIITGLHVIMDKCLLIGNPVPLHKSNSAEEPIPACSSKQVTFHYSYEVEDSLNLSADLKKFDDFWDNLTSNEIGFDKIWSDLMLDLEYMKLGSDKNTEAELEAAQAQLALLCRDGTDHSAMNMFKRVCTGEIDSDDEKEDEIPSYVDL